MARVECLIAVGREGEYYMWPNGRVTGITANCIFSPDNFSGRMRCPHFKGEKTPRREREEETMNSEVECWRRIAARYSPHKPFEDKE